MNSTPTRLVSDLDDYTVFHMLIYLFLAVILFSVYINTRLVVILARRFRYECSHNYYPMLILMNILSFIALLILLAGCLLPWFSYGFSEFSIDYDVIMIPFIYALVAPTEIAAVDFILCGMRVIAHRHPTSTYKWIGVVIFFGLSPALAFISYHAQLFTVAGKDFKPNTPLFAAFLIDNILKACCSVGSFVGYCVIFVWSRRTRNSDSIIRQAFPIAGFQTMTVIVQIIMEMPFAPQLAGQERFVLDICFSAACSVVVPLCTMIGESKKRDMFYDTVCCCYCYCEPRACPVRVPVNGASRADRQLAERHEAIKARQEEEEQRKRRGPPFSSLEDSGGSHESAM